MEERPYGKTGEKFPILSFGAMSPGERPEREAEELISDAIDHGIRYFDTAWWYGDGESEERLGLTDAGKRREARARARSMPAPFVYRVGSITRPTNSTVPVSISRIRKMKGLSISTRVISGIAVKPTITPVAAAASVPASSTET